MTSRLGPYRTLRMLFAPLCFTLLAANSAQSNPPGPVDCSTFRWNLPSFEALEKAFDYNKYAPLGLQTLASIDHDGIREESIEFAGVSGARCSAAVLTPLGQGKFPAVVWLGSGDKDWESYATEFSKLGAVSFLLDDCGKASVYDAKGLRADDIQDVINIRRAVDILSARPVVNPNRIAFVGHSGGAMLGADAVAVDKRFKAAVFESGLQGFTYHICTSSHPFAIDVRTHLNGNLAAYVKALAPLDAVLYVGHAAPTVLLFQSGTLDKGVPQSDANAFFNAASEPKTLLWYDTEHKMDIPQVSYDRTEFLKKQLEMH